MASDNVILHAAFRSDFPTFLRKVFQTLNPGKKFIPGWHVDAIGYVLEGIACGRVHQQLIAMPPRYLKSTIISVAYVAWCGGPTLLDSLAAPLRCIPVPDHAAKILFITSCCGC